MLGVFPQNAQSFSIPIREVIILAMFAVIIIALPEELHWSAALGAVHSLVILFYTK